MKRICHLDIETFSACNLTTAGVYRYAEHESTELLCATYAFDGEKPVLWVPYEKFNGEVWSPLFDTIRNAHGIFSAEVPEDLRAHIEAGCEVRCHNAQFERVVLNGVAGQKLNFPKIAIEQTVCTAAKMAAHGLPRKLGDAAKALDAHQKDDAGRIIMLQLSKPRKGKEPRYTPENSPDKFLTLYKYNIDDVEAERSIDHLVPDLTPREQKVYHLDQLINQRGIKADIDAIRHITAVVDEYKKFLADACEKATKLKMPEDSEIAAAEAEAAETRSGIKPTQRDKIATWVRDNGYPQLGDMQAETVKAIVADPNVPDKVKHVLRIYSTYNMKAVTKYQAILDAVCDDGRLHGMFLYLGAGTGRWSSLIVQLQNLFRPVIDDPDTAIDAFSARSLEWIRALYDGVDPMKVAASCIRGTLVADEGKDLLFLDYAGIESRVNAWLFDEKWKLDMFRMYDRKEGPDSYCVAYCSAFGGDPSAIGKKDPRRQLGKVIDLFGGYEGGVGAFVVMADTYGVDLEEMTEQVWPLLPEWVFDSAEWMWENFGKKMGLPKKVYLACDAIKQLNRRDQPKIVQGWKDLKAAAEQAVQNPGRAYFIPNKKIGFAVMTYGTKQWLQMKLPTGRRLHYFSPSWKPERTEVRMDERGVEYLHTVPGELRYWGIDTNTRQWKQVSSYGGRWCENAVQAISRDLLVNGMFNVEKAGYPIIGSVHDEAIMEILEGFGSLDNAGKLMCNLEPWAAGLPMAIEGHRAKRYRK